MLTLAVGVLLAVVAPRMHERYAVNRVERATQRLLAAAKADDLQGAAAAIAASADVEGKDEQFSTPLAYAIRNGNLQMVELLLTAGADPNQFFTWPAGDIFLPLEFAAELNRPEIAQRLVAAGGRSSRRNAVQICIEKGHPETLKVLLARGGGEDWIVATMKSNLEHSQKLQTARTLLDHRRADDRQFSRSIQPAITHALQTHDEPLADLLREFGAPWTAREAAAFNRLDELRRMIEDDPDLVHQRFPAYYYSTPGQDPILLDIALSHGHRELALYLMEAGASLEALVWPNATMLHRAAIGGDTELVRYLAARCVPVNGRDDYGDTPLTEAVYRGHAEVVAALVEFGADVNVAMRIGSTPLHAAGNDLNIVRQLLDAGADPAARNRDGKTPYDVAMERGDTVVAKLLVDAIASAESRQSSLQRQDPPRGKVTP